MGKYTASVQDHLVLPARVFVTPGIAHHLRSLGRTVPAPVSIRLVIDTGSKRTTLMPEILRHLQLFDAAGKAQVVTSLARFATDLFWISLEFPDAGLATIPELLVARLPLPPRLGQFHGLAGRDLLRQFESFEYEGRRGCYTLRDKPGMFTWLRRWL